MVPERPVSSARRVVGVVVTGGYAVVTTGLAVVGVGVVVTTGLAVVGVVAATGLVVGVGVVVTTGAGVTGLVVGAVVTAGAAAVTAGLGGAATGVAVGVAGAAVAGATTGEDATDPSGGVATLAPAGTFGTRPVGPTEARVVGGGAVVLAAAMIVGSAVVGSADVGSAVTGSAVTGSAESGGGATDGVLVASATVAVVATTGDGAVAVVVDLRTGAVEVVDWADTKSAGGGAGEADSRDSVHPPSAPSAATGIIISPSFHHGARSSNSSPSLSPSMSLFYASPTVVLIKQSRDTFTLRDRGANAWHGRRRSQPFEAASAGVNTGTGSPPPSVTNCTCIGNPSASTSGSIPGSATFIHGPSASSTTAITEASPPALASSGLTAAAWSTAQVISVAAPVAGIHSS